MMEPPGLGGPVNRAPYIWVGIACVGVLILILSMLGVGRPAREDWWMPPPQPDRMLVWSAYPTVSNDGSVKSVQAGQQPADLQPSCQMYQMPLDGLRAWINLTWQPKPEGATRLKLTLREGSCTGTAIAPPIEGTGPLSLDKVEVKMANTRVAVTIGLPSDGASVDQPFHLTFTPWTAHIVTVPTTSPSAT